MDDFIDASGVPSFSNKSEILTAGLAVVAILLVTAIYVAYGS